MTVPTYFLGLVPVAEGVGGEGGTVGGSFWGVDVGVCLGGGGGGGGFGEGLEDVLGGKLHDE